MMVALAIMAVLATVVAPKFIGFIEVAESGAQTAEKQSVKTALKVMMADQRIFTINSLSGGTSVNDWAALPSGPDVSPLTNYLEDSRTTYFYCYDAYGTITRQDPVASPACP